MSKSIYKNYKKKYYTQFGELYVYDKLLLVCDLEKVLEPSSVVDFPVTRSRPISPTIPEYTFRYERIKVDLTKEVFKYDKDLGKINFNDAINEIAIRGMFPNTMVAVLIEDSFYIYNDPKLHCYKKYGKVLNRNLEPVYKINAISSGLLKNIFKATKLAKKIYPNAKEKDGWIYTW